MPMLSRANSSPNLKDRWNSTIAERDISDDDYDDEFYVIGDRVYVDGHRPGSVAYFGETEFGSGDWVGVALDEPTGNHDGKLHGREYFQCSPHHGLFVRAHRVSRISDSALGSSAASSRSATPLPTFQHHAQHRPRLEGPYTKMGKGERSQRGLRAATPDGYRARVGGSGGPLSSTSSPLDSYYYDEDYRQDQAPSVASLARKLRSINEQGQRQQPQQGSVSRTSNKQAPVGILKRGSYTPAVHSDALDNRGSTKTSNLSSRVDELNRRLRASSTSPGSTATPRSVFNFRPKREQLAAGAQMDDRHRDATVRRSIFLSEAPPEVGDRVLVRTERGGELSGVLRFLGETNFATGEWAGVALDEPVGKNDGSILGHRYFHCPREHGLFVPATRVRRLDQPEILMTRRHREPGHICSNPSIFSSMRSTIKSPPPVKNLSGHGSSRSTTPSYDLGALSPSTSLSTSNSSPSQQSNACERRQPSNYFAEHSPRPSPVSPSQPPLSRTNLELNSHVRPSPRTRGSSDKQGFYENLMTDDYQKHHLRSSASSSALADRSWRRPKFDDHDIEIQLRKSLDHQRLAASNIGGSLSSSSNSLPKPKAVTYTFISNKSNGNPIAKRTLLYE